MSSGSASVAIVGGGISGLVCANRLQQLGINNVTIYDTGKNSVGGRCSSRDVMINGRLHTFDHSAQYFTVGHPQFANVVSFLHKKGAVKVWKGPLGHLKKNGNFEKYAEPYQAFVGCEGMKSIPECLAHSVNVQRPVWISNVAWQPDMLKWKVHDQGYFDYLVVAHNGKCADRLMENAGAPALHSLLRVRFGDHLIRKDARMQLCSLWVLLVAFPQSLMLPYEGAHVDNDDISWIGNNTAKLRKHTGKSGQKSSSDSLECWTIFSTRKFGTANKVPQEMIPPKKADEITNRLLEAFCRVTKVPRSKANPCYSRVQLWGAGVPMNTLDNGDSCVFDGTRQTGICGDWLVSPCLQGAALSGIALAEKIHKHAKGVDCDSRMDAAFKPADHAAIGAFPTHPNFIFNPK